MQISKLSAIVRHWKKKGLREKWPRPWRFATKPFHKTPVMLDFDFPLPPRTLLANRLVCEIPLIERRIPRVPHLRDADTSLIALYRIYEHIILDQWINIRNEFESFWYHSDWAVCNIADPHDPHPERYACVASITGLLCLAFNRRIGLGLPRDAPPIFSPDMLEEWRTREPRYETEPEWALAVPRLAAPLAIPHWDNKQRDFVPLDSFDDRRASVQFSKKNILIWQPHVHFA
ncbi:hypothetical protein E4U54_005536 [Claviceps lovelessii]|nr:hypothetical protein E4U54_005536 [Claviceps lovelessii]